MASCCQSHPGCAVVWMLATSPDNWAVPEVVAHVDSPSYEHTNIHATKHSLRQQSTKLYYILMNISYKT